MERNIHYKLNLIKLHCYISDEADADEVYLKMDGEKIWPREENFVSMKQSSEDIKLEFTVEKGSKKIIEVWDYDYVSKNDLLGKIEIVVDVAGGPFNMDMTREESDIAKYGLEYEIN